MSRPMHDFGPCSSNWYLEELDREAEEKAREGLWKIDDTAVDIQPGEWLRSIFVSSAVSVLGGLLFYAWLSYR